MVDGRRWDVFLAYASPDRERARMLHQALTAAGLSVCFDVTALRGGDNWQRDLPGHLRSSAVVVALISSHTSDATYENAEVIRALAQVRREGARLVPVRLSADAELPYGTEALVALEYFDPDGTAGVVDAIVDVARNPTNAATLVGSQVWCGRVPALPVVFAGREVLLERLGESISGGSGAVLTQTIQGMGGVGKTTVAAALAGARRQQLDIVWWVRAEQPAVLVADLAELAPRVGVSVDDDPGVTATSVREWLETTTRPWLVVFDNAPDESSIEPWRPRWGHGATVVTSRNRNMSRLGEVISVDTFPSDVAEKFLRNRVRWSNSDAADEDLTGVLARLMGLPLALEQAAAWVDTLTSRNNLAYAYQSAGHLGRAVPLYEANLADRQRVLGPDHPDTLASRNNLADAVLAMKRNRQ